MSRFLMLTCLVEILLTNVVQNCAELPYLYTHAKRDSKDTVREANAVC